MRSAHGKTDLTPPPAHRPRAMNTTLEQELARLDISYALELAHTREVALRRQRNQELAARLYLESFLGGRPDIDDAFPKPKQ